jgi:streptogrisin C
MALALTASAASAQSADRVQAKAALVKSMSRDLGLTAERAEKRLAAEDLARERHPRLRQGLGAGYAGAWFDAEKLELVVASTDPGAAKLAQANGARAVLVTRSLEQLTRAQRRLDQAAIQMTDAQRNHIWTWAVDVKTNVIVITIPADDAAAKVNVQDFIALANVDPTWVRVEQMQGGRPTPAYSVRGGDEITINGRSCSVGFSVVGGFVTAGHCSGGSIGDTVKGYTGTTMGTVAGATYPFEDRAWVQTNSNFTPSPCVGTGSDRDCNAAGNVLVLGSQEAVVGASVCRWGHRPGREGPWCGVISAKDVSASIPTVVNHLVQTNICSDEGDSGAPFMAGNQAQGILALSQPGSLCPDGIYGGGKAAWYYPINLTLNAFGLTLAVPQPPPAVPATPQNFRVTYTWSPSKYRFTASWSPSPGATMYRMTGHVVNTPNTSISWTVPDNWEDLSIEYSLRACNAGGCSAPAGPVAAQY